MADKTTTEQSVARVVEMATVRRILYEAQQRHIHHCTNSVVAQDFCVGVLRQIEAGATNTEPTVEQALVELREMFPDKLPFIRSEHSLHHNDVVYSHWEVSVEQREWRGATLNEAITNLRQWHAEQAKR